MSGEDWNRGEFAGEYLGTSATVDSEYRRYSWCSPKFAGWQTIRDDRVAVVQAVSCCIELAKASADHRVGCRAPGESKARSKPGQLIWILPVSGNAGFSAGCGYTWKSSRSPSQGQVGPDAISILDIKAKIRNSERKRRRPVDCLKRLYCPRAKACRLENS